MQGKNGPQSEKANLKKNNKNKRNQKKKYTKFRTDCLIPLHPAQENVYFEQNIHPKNAFYNIGWHQLIKGHIDRDLFEIAWQAIYKNIDALRINISTTEDGIPYQYDKTEESFSFPLTYVDLANELNPKEKAQEWMQERLETVVSFLDAQLSYAALIDVGVGEHYLYLQLHHLIIDGIGIYRLFEVFQKTYQCLVDGSSLDWLESIPQYLPEAEKASQYLSSNRYELDKKHWKGFFASKEITRLSEPYQDKNTSVFIKALDKQTENLFRNFSERYGHSPLAMMVAITSVYLKYTLGVNEPVIGTAVHGRQGRQAMNIVGMHSNVVPVAGVLDSEQSFLSLLEDTSKQIKTSLKRSRFPTSHMARLTQGQGKNLEGQLVDVQVLYDVFSDSELSIGQSIQTTHMCNRFENQPLQIRLQNYGISSDLKLRVTYMRSYFSEKEIRMMSRRIINLLKYALQAPEQKWVNLPCLLDEERKRILTQINSVPYVKPTGQAIHGIFEKAAHCFPDNPALVFEGKTLSYRELNERTNQVAHHIREKYRVENQAELTADTLIALYLDRGFDMVVGILAVLKAGAAYVPISISTPRERCEFILSDCAAKFVLTEEKYAEKLNSFAKSNRFQTINVDGIEHIEQYPKANPNPISNADDLAYVIYTSGTTGQPKGVLQLHKNVERLFTNTQKYFNFCADDTWALYHAYSFDFSVWEIWGALHYGGKLILPREDEIRDFPRFVSLCVERGLTVLNQTPNAFYAFAEEAVRNRAVLDKLKYVIFGGDTLTFSQLRGWWDYSEELFGKSQPQLINMYGITETTVHVTYKRITKNEVFAPESSSNIGVAISDLKTYVLNDNKQLLPPMVAGELYVGGAGLARGYLNRAELTNERFIENPYVTETDLALGNNKLYKTGDLVRQLDDGNFEYLGRNDFQVKIRGYRIELGEIEAALLQHEHVNQAIVVCQDANSIDVLHSYIVPAELDRFDSESIRLHLQEILPDYMVPVSFTPLSAIPLTHNGKLDKNALPAPEVFHSEDDDKPANEQEQKLCELWQKVLDVDVVGVNDDFFRLGGNSILAIRLVNQMNMAFHSQLTVKDIFTEKTVRNCNSLIQRSLGSFLYKDHAIKSSNSEQAYKSYPLSNVQQAYLYGRLGSFGMGNVSTHLYTEHVFDDLNIEKLETCFNILIERHASLRSVFSGESQRVLSSVEPYTVVDYGELSTVELEELRSQLSHKLYSPDQYPLFDFSVSRSDGKSTLHLSIDALIMDGSSLAIFFKELTRLYLHEEPTGRVLPELPVTFRDYIQSHQNIRSSELFEDAKQYWLDKLEEYNFDASLPMVCNPGGVKTPKFSRLSKTIPKRVWEKIEKKAQDNKISPTSVVLYAYGVVLSRWSGKESLCINLTLFNRLPLHEKINDVIGDFTVLELFNFSDQRTKTIRNDLQNIHAQLWEDIEHNLFDGIDFQRVIRKELNFRREQVLSPVVLTSVLGDKTTPFSKIQGYNGEGYSITQTSQVYLDNKAFETEEGFVAEWDYVDQLFDKNTITQMHRDYCDVIEQLANVKWDDAPLSNVPLAQQDLDLIRVANSDEQEEVTQSMVDICMSTIGSLPNNIAVIDHRGGHSYAQLGLACERIAKSLVSNGHPQAVHYQNTLIAVLSEKAFPQVSACLGIMSTGAGYLPLHVDWPLNRINEVLKEGEVTQVLVSRQQYENLIQGSELETAYTWHIIEMLSEESAIDSKEIPLPEFDLDDIAYVIFTSGSTGKPKGVTISHRGAVNTLVAVNNRFNVTEKDRVLALSELSFDLSVYDLFGLLAAGGAIVYPEQEKTKDPQHWHELVQTHQVSLWNTVPQLMQLYVDYVESTNGNLNTFKAVLMSGDWIPLNLPEKIKALNSQTTVMSLGGATEGSIWSIWYEVNGLDPRWKSIPYGYAMPNQKMYVIDHHQQLSPVGVTGEIAIGGVGVALNYWKDEAKTHASFIDHPTLGRLYKTGDLGRWSTAGYIEFEGRKDKQVKINGYRVELEEIESVLASLKEIKQAVAVVQDNDGRNVLGAYLVPEVSDKGIDELFLQNYLAERLPEYMVPSVFVLLDSLPLTANGKLDKGRLPTFDVENSEDYVAPKTEVEVAIAQLWQEILGAKKVGIHDDFFALGGDSIIAIQLVSKMRQQGIQVQVRNVFEFPTVSTLTAHLQTNDEPVNQAESESGQLEGRFKLLPIQQWFFEQEFACRNYWNQAFTITLPAGTPYEDIVSSVKQLFVHHDILRCRFCKTDVTYEQEYVSVEEFQQPEIIQIDAQTIEVEALSKQLTQLQNQFDIFEGPLWSVAHITGCKNTNNNDVSKLFFAFHHLIMDTVSWRIIADDVQTLLSNMRGTLQEKSSSYRQWVQAIAEYGQSLVEGADSELAYWQELIAEEKDLTEAGLETQLKVGLNEELTHKLVYEANKGFNTEINDLLLSATSIALSQLFDRKYCTITLEGHGREELSDLDISRTLGWFTTMYPVRLTAGESIEDTIVQTKESLRQVPNKGLGFGALCGTGKLSFSDLPKVSFNYLGILDGRSETGKTDWQILTENAGEVSSRENTDNLLLNIYGAIKNSKLSFNLFSKLPNALTEEFKVLFEAALIQVIEAALLASANGGVKTPSDFVAEGLTPERVRKLQNQYDLEEICPANGLQQGFIYHHLSHPEDDAYRVQVLMDYHQAIDTEAYKNAWVLASLKFPALRAAFDWNGNLVQVVTQGASIDQNNFKFLDLSHLPGDMRQAEIDRLQKEDRHTPFDFSIPGQIRLVLIKQTEQQYSLLKTVHHIAADGWSGALLWDAVHKYYDGLTQKPTGIYDGCIASQKLPISEVDGAFYKAQAYFQKNSSESEDYWREVKQKWGEPNDLGLLTEAGKTSVRVDLNQNFSGDRQNVAATTIEGEAFNGLKNLCRQQGVTLNVALQFAWHKLIQLYTLDEITSVGTIVSGRDIPIANVESSIGLYINTLPLVVNWQDNTKTIDILKHIQSNVAELNSYSAMPLSKLQDDGERLFHSLFAFENYPDSGEPDKESISSSAEPVMMVEKHDYPVAVIAFEKNGALHIEFKYKQSIFSEADIENLLRQISCILLDIEPYIDESHQKFSLTNSSFEESFQWQWNQEKESYPASTLLSDYEKQLKTKGDNLAVITPQANTTYLELEQYRLRLSSVLLKNAPEKGELIAVLCEKNEFQVAACLAVMSAACAYLPLNVSWPEERLHDVLSAGGCKRVCVSVDQFERVRNENWVDKFEWIVLQKAVNTTVENTALPKIYPEDIAYVIFTSGSTGKPKGVVISHEGAMNTIHAVNQRFSATEKDRVLALSDLSFDLSVYDIFGLLATGGAIVFPEQNKVQDPSHWVELVDEHSITLWDTVPQLVQLLMHECQLMAAEKAGRKNLQSLRLVLMSGDWIPLNLPNEIKAQLNEKAVVMSLGGATEGSIWSIWYPIESVESDWPSVPYGVAMPNQQMWVLDEAGQPCPTGVTGEIHIGGLGVAKGYYKDPVRTEAQFFTHEVLGPLYKTGDLGAWNPLGYIEFQGRKDFQVKIRGYRIELGEIESTLMALPEVKQATVIALEQEGNKYLSAYTVSHSGKAIDSGYLREQVSSKLPEYMVPSAFTDLKEIPLTANGKLDRQALPIPTLEESTAFIAPQTELQKQLRDIWQKVLNSKNIGIDDNFFRIGGDSILSIQMMSHLRKAGFNLQLRKLFELPTISKLAEHLENHCAEGVDQESSINAEQGILTGEFGLLPVQQWFFDQGWSNPHYWNQAFKLSVPVDTKFEDVKTALDTLASHHDSLRCLFRETNGTVTQIYQPNCASIQAPPVYLDTTELNQKEVEETLSNLQSEFNIFKGPLWRGVYLTNQNNGMAEVVLCFHHLVIDAVSWRILAEDLETLLKVQSIPEKTSSYRQWVNEIQQYTDNNPEANILSEVSYWKKQNNSATEISIPLEETVETSDLHFSKEFSDLLIRKANGGYQTEINDLLLAAFVKSLYWTFGEKSYQITLEGHGREDINPQLDISRTTGWFTTMYPVSLTASDNLEEHIVQTKEILRAIPNKGIGYSALKQAGYLTGVSLSQISFNYLGQFDSQAGSEGVWQLVTSGCGQQIDSINRNNLQLEVNGLIENGELCFVINSRLPKEITEALNQNFHQALARLVKHCVNIASQGGAKTPSDYPVKDLNYNRLERLNNTYSIESLYPATSLQQGFVVHHLSHPQDDAYRVQILLDYKTNLDIEKYIQAWRLASKRYPALRVAFDWEGEPLQIITQEASISDRNFTLLDISGLSDTERELKIREIQEEDRTKPFDLSKPGLIRFTLIKQSENLFTLLKTEHHSIADGWSSPVLLHSVHQNYNSLIQRQDDDCQVEIETAYERAQEYYIAHQPKCEQFWGEARSHWGEANDLNVMFSQSTRLSEIKHVEKPQRKTLELVGADLSQLKAMCRTVGVTLNVALQFAWHKLIQIYTQDEQSIVGTTVSGRDIPVEGVESSVGLYINTLPLVVRWEEGESCSEMLQQIQREIANLNTYSSMPLAKLQTQGERLFHSLFVFENYPSPTNHIGDADIEKHLDYRGVIEKDNYPLSIIAYEKVEDDSLYVALNYGADWLTETQSEKLLNQLLLILRQIAISPELTHESISLLTQKERQQIMEEWNNTEKQWAEASNTQKYTLHGLFEQQVMLTPNATAIVCEGEQLTYQELDHRANFLAQVICASYIEKHGGELPADTLVALCLNRSLDMVVAILAVLKAGAAYIPVAPDYPQERVEFILQDSECCLVLTEKTNKDLISSAIGNKKTNTELVCIDELESLNTEPRSWQSAFNKNDLAYVIYTSGTTGKPKGVCVEHASACNTLYAMTQVYDFSSGHNKVSCFSNYTFDVSVSEIFNSLCFGGELHIFNQELRINPQKLFEYVVIQKINYLFVPPAVLAVLPKGDAPSLKAVIFAGEACEQSACMYWAENYALYNYYGPTEASIYASGKLAHPRNLNEIGKPLENTQLYVLDSAMQPVPVGVPGELYIGGAGLAREYHKRKDLTQKHFVTNPFAKNESQSRLYKTGDVVRWLEDGNLEYMGRNDFQVKIRGFRIELGEIESALVALNNVKQVAVIAREKEGEKAGKRLDAYVVLDSGEVYDEAALRESLLKTLPEYQVPSTFTQLDELPLNTNGKLDRHRLPEPSQQQQDSYLAPTTALEEKLCDIWQEVLELEQVGILDNFYWIGGNSISAVGIVTRSQALLTESFTLIKLVELKNIQAICAWYLENNEFSNNSSEEDDQESSEEIMTI